MGGLQPCFRTVSRCRWRRCEYVDSLGSQNELEGAPPPGMLLFESPVRVLALCSRVSLARWANSPSGWRLSGGCGRTISQSVSGPSEPAGLHLPSSTVRNVLVGFLYQSEKVCVVGFKLLASKGKSLLCGDSVKVGRNQSGQRSAASMWYFEVKLFCFSRFLYLDLMQARC